MTDQNLSFVGVILETFLSDLQLVIGHIQILKIVKFGKLSLKFLLYIIF